MSLRFIKWLIVALIATAIVIALSYFSAQEAEATEIACAADRIYQNAEMPATPWPPARQADSRWAGLTPPSA